MEQPSCNIQKEPADSQLTHAERRRIESAREFSRRHRLALQGDADAQLHLGAVYDDGEGVRRNFALAAYWYRQAARQGNSCAQRRLGDMYQYGAGVAQNAREAVRWYRKAARRGDAGACTALASLYDDAVADAVAAEKPAYAKAARWYRKAAESGDAYAQIRLGERYRKGQGVKQDYRQALAWFHKAAEQRYREAYFHIGLMHLHGEGVEQDYVRAAAYFLRAGTAELGSAGHHLGLLYLQGLGVEQDDLAAALLFRDAAEVDDGAALQLGLMYRDGRGVMRDDAEAAYWFYRAAEYDGNDEAIFRLAEAYRSGRGVAADPVGAYVLFEAVRCGSSAFQTDAAVQCDGLRDHLSADEIHVATRLGRELAGGGNLTSLLYARFRELPALPPQRHTFRDQDAHTVEMTGLANDAAQFANWRSLAQQGDAQAQYRFGVMCEWGMAGVSASRSEALLWYRKAAEQGIAQAQYKVAAWLDFRRIDFHEAVDWYLLAAEQGLVAAQFRLGELLAGKWLSHDNDDENAFRGYEGLAVDDALAAYWYRRAALQGYARAQTSLGFICETGRGITRDFEEAACWYRKAALQRDEEAQYRLGRFYEQGWGGLPRDDNEAVKWYRQAAERLNRHAQYRLALLYFHGRGVAANDKRAAFWLHQAISHPEQEDGAVALLGFLYDEGRGVARNPVAAYALLRDIHPADAPALAWVGERLAMLTAQLTLEERSAGDQLWEALRWGSDYGLTLKCYLATGEFQH